jgi:hypothetical protein
MEEAAGTSEAAAAAAAAAAAVAGQPSSRAVLHHFEFCAALGLDPSTGLPLDDKEPVLYLIEPDPFNALDEWTQ